MMLHLNKLLGFVVVFLVHPQWGRAEQPSFLRWQTLEQATTLAQEQQILLMVVQGPDDFSRTPDQCPLAEQYAKSAFPDNRLADFYEFRVAPCYRPSGPMRSQPRAGTRSAAGGNVITYFCTGDQRVLHFVVGYPTPEHMQAHTDWAFSLLTRIQQVSPDDQAQLVGDAHRRKLATANPTTAWTALFRDVVRAGKPQLSSLLNAAAQLRDQQIVARYGRGWTPGERIALVASLRLHAEIETEYSHRVLLTYPLLRLRQLEQLAFEAFTRQKYWAPPVRRQLLTDWFRAQREEGKPLLLVVSRVSKATGDDKPQQIAARQWEPKRAAISGMLREFAVLELSRGELACLLSDFSLTLSEQNDFNKLRFLIFGTDQEQPTQLTRDKDEAQLQRAMAKALAHD